MFSQPVQGARQPARKSEREFTPDEKAFSSAVCSRDCETIKRLVKNGANVDQRVYGGRYALAAAACDGDTDVVLTLIECGANVNGPPGAHEKPLQIAAEFKRWQTVAALLDKGADPDASNGLGTTALHSAAVEGRLDIVEKLIKKGAKIDARDHNMCTPLDNATNNKHLDVMQVLLKAGADPNAMEAFGATPLAKAVSRGTTEMIRALLDAGASIEVILLVNGSPHCPIMSHDTQMVCQASFYGRDYGGLTPFHIAVSKGRLDILAMLLAVDASAVKAKTSNGWTPLHLACEMDRTDIAEFLISKGADLSAVDAKGLQPIHLSAGNDSVSTLDMLFKKGVKLETLSSSTEKNTAAHIAERKGALLAAAFLYEKGASGEIKNADGVTPLSLKEERRKNTMTRFNELASSPQKFFDHGKRNGDGVLNIGSDCFHGKESEIQYTPEFLKLPRLHKAVAFSMYDAIDIFIGEGDDPGAADPNGRTALDYAFKRNERECAKILIADGAIKNLGDTEKSGYFEKCIANNWNSVAKLIIKQGASPLKTGGDGENAFHMAAINGNSEMLAMIIPDAKKYDETCLNGSTAAIHAAESGKKTCLGMLIDAESELKKINKNGCDALLSVMRNNEFNEKDCIELVESLINKKAINVENSSAYILEALNRGFERYDRSKCKFTEEHRIKLIELLVKGGVTLSGRSGHQPLLQAISDSRTEMAGVLIRLGARPDDDPLKEPVLSKALANLDTECVKLLLESGATAEITDKNGNSSIMAVIDAIEGLRYKVCSLADFSKSCDKAIEIIEMLEKRGCKIDAANKAGETPLSRVMKWNATVFSRNINCREDEILAQKKKFISVLDKKK